MITLPSNALPGAPDAVLDHLMADRRRRLSSRCVKRPMGRYAYKILRVGRRTYTATCSIASSEPN
jgi:hypothetical protein